MGFNLSLTSFTAATRRTWYLGFETSFQELTNVSCICFSTSPIFVSTPSCAYLFHRSLLSLSSFVPHLEKDVLLPCSPLASRWPTSVEPLHCSVYIAYFIPHIFQRIVILRMVHVSCIRDPNANIALKKILPNDLMKNERKGITYPSC